MDPWEMADLLPIEDLQTITDSFITTFGPKMVFLLGIAVALYAVAKTVRWLFKSLRKI